MKFLKDLAMLRGSKRADLQWSTIVYAIIAILVLVVAIAIFYSLTKGPIIGIFGFGNNAQQQTNELTIKINNVLGGCDHTTDTKTRCSFGKLVQCDEDDKWAIKGDCED